MKRGFDSTGHAAFRADMIVRLLFLASASAAFAVTSAVPEPFPATRYDKLRAESPFAVATAVEAPKEEKISWAQNLYIGSVAKLKQTGEERDWVVIKDRTQPGSIIQLFGNDVNAEGYQLVKLEWTDDPKKMKAQVKKGTEFATLEMDQAAFTSVAPMPAPAGVVPARVVPGQPNLPAAASVPANAIRPPTAPGAINKPAVPAVRPPVSIPRPTTLPPAVNQVPQPGAPNAAPAPNTRSRIRVIPNQ